MIEQNNRICFDNIVFFEKTPGTDAVFSGQLRSCQYGRRPRTMHGYPAKDVQIMFDRRPKTRCECQITILAMLKNCPFFINFFHNTLIIFVQNLDPIIVCLSEIKWLDRVI